LPHTLVMYQLYSKQQKGRTDRCHTYGISMPLEILEKVDKQRGDIPRSRFLLRMIENNLATLESKSYSGQKIPSSALSTTARSKPVEELTAK
jgi:hypothetical protein